MFKLNSFVGAVGVCFLAAASGFASDLTLDGEVELRAVPIGTSVEVSLTGAPGQLAVLALDLSPGPVFAYGESIAIGLTPALLILPPMRTNRAGVATMTLPVPAELAFVGLTVYAVGVVLEPRGRTGLDFSNGVEMTLVDLPVAAG